MRAGVDTAWYDSFTEPSARLCSPSVPLPRTPNSDQPNDQRPPSASRTRLKLVPQHTAWGGERWWVRLWWWWWWRRRRWRRWRRRWWRLLTAAVGSPVTRSGFASYSAPRLALPPTHPCFAAPLAQTPPSRASQSVCAFPVAAPTTPPPTPLRYATGTGPGRVAVSPTPSWPRLFLPHAYAAPSTPSATQCAEVEPLAMKPILTPLSPATSRCGPYRLGDSSVSVGFAPASQLVEPKTTSAPLAGAATDAGSTTSAGVAVDAAGIDEVPADVEDAGIRPCAISLARIIS